MRRQQRKRQTKPPGRVRIITIEEMEFIRDNLEAVSAPGTDPGRQLAVIAAAAQYRGAYYRTKLGNLRRVFPKATEVVLFRSVAAQPSSQAMLRQFSGGQPRGGGCDAE